MTEQEFVTYYTKGLTASIPEILSTVQQNDFEGFVKIMQHYMNTGRTQHEIDTMNRTQVGYKENLALPSFSAETLLVLRGSFDKFRAAFEAWPASGESE